MLEWIKSGTAGLLDVLLHQLKRWLRSQSGLRHERSTDDFLGRHYSLLPSFKWLKSNNRRLKLDDVGAFGLDASGLIQGQTTRLLLGLGLVAI